MIAETRAKLSQTELSERERERERQREIYIERVKEERE